MLPPATLPDPPGHTYIHIYIYRHIHIYIYTYIHWQFARRTYTCISIQSILLIEKQSYRQSPIWMKHVRIHIHVHVHIHIHSKFARRTIYTFPAYEPSPPQILHFKLIMFRSSAWVYSATGELSVCMYVWVCMYTRTQIVIINLLVNRI